MNQLENNNEGFHWGHVGIVAGVAVVLVMFSYVKDPEMFNFSGSGGQLTQEVETGEPSVAGVYINDGLDPRVGRVSDLPASKPNEPIRGPAIDE